MDLFCLKRSLGKESDILETVSGHEDGDGVLGIYDTCFEFIQIENKLN